MTDLVERYFDGAAAIYNDATSTDESWSITRYVRDSLENIPRVYNSALAIGAGTGYDVDLLKELDVSSITMLDISRKMLDAAAERHPDIPQIHGDIMNEASIDGRFDLILCVGVVEFISDITVFLKRCAALLNPGGSLIVTYEPIIRGYRPQTARSELVHSREQDPIYNCDGVVIHRIDLGAFVSSCVDVGFEMREHSLVQAYVEEAPIFYGLATLRCIR